MGYVIWILFCVGIGYFAHTRGRNPVGWGALALLISPLIAGIILAVIKDLNTEEKIRSIDTKTENLKMEMNYNQKFNDYRSDHMSSQMKSLNSHNKNNDRLNSSSSELRLDRKIQCNSCGEMASYNSKFCHKCGKELIKEKNCKICNKAYPIDSKFCPHCGSKAETDKFCPDCGAQMEVGTKYCPNCGNSVQ